MASTLSEQWTSLQAMVSEAQSSAVQQQIINNMLIDVLFHAMLLCQQQEDYWSLQTLILGKFALELPLELISQELYDMLASEYNNRATSRDLFINKSEVLTWQQSFLTRFT